MALIILCAMPVFASTPEQDMVLIVDEGDGDFSGLQQISDEEMSGVEGEGANLENWEGSIVIYHYNSHGESSTAVITTPGSGEYIINDLNHDGIVDQYDLVLLVENNGGTIADAHLLGALLCGWNFRYDRPLTPREKIQLAVLFAGGGADISPQFTY